MIIEKDGQIIVDELRPMSDAPKRDRLRLNSENYPAIIAFRKGGKYGSLVDWSPIFKKWRISIEYYSDDSFHGWIPMPIYQPKSEHEKNAQEHFSKVAG